MGPSRLVVLCFALISLLLAGDVRKAYRAAVSRLKQDFDQRLAQAEVRFMEKADQTAANPFSPHHSHVSGHPGGTSAAQIGAKWGHHAQNSQQAPSATTATTYDVSRQLQELQVNLHDQVHCSTKDQELPLVDAIWPKCTKYTLAVALCNP